MTENGIYDQIDLSFGHFKTTSVCDRQSPKTDWNTVKEMFLIFRTTPLVVCCMAATPFVATALYFIQSKPCFSMNWFHLAKMAWAVEKTPTLRQHNSTVVFVSSLANLQHKINCTFSEIRICCLIELNTKQLSFLQLVKKLFQQIGNMKTSTFSCIAD